MLLQLVYLTSHLNLQFFYLYLLKLLHLLQFHMPDHARYDVGQLLFCGLQIAAEKLFYIVHPVEDGVPVDIHAGGHGLDTAAALQIHFEGIHIIGVMFFVVLQERVQFALAEIPEQAFVRNCIKQPVDAHLVKIRQILTLILCHENRSPGPQVGGPEICNVHHLAADADPDRSVGHLFGQAPAESIDDVVDMGFGQCVDNDHEVRIIVEKCPLCVRFVR